MKTTSKFPFAIFCFSEMTGDFAPTQWGTFDSFAQAEEFAAKNIKHTNFKVDFVG